MVIFFNAPVRMVEAWRRGVDWLPDEIAVLADPDATLYEALGTQRKSGYVSLMRGQVGPALKSAREGKFARLTRADMLRLGADVAVRADGEIAKLHLATSPEDRIDVGELVAALTVPTNI
jgi:hypothetical protein